MIFGLDTETKSSSTHTQKPSEFRSLHWDQVDLDITQTSISTSTTHKEQVNFDAHTEPSHFRPAHKNKVICFHFTQKPSQSNLTLKTSYFGPHTKTNDTHTKINQISIRTLQPSHFRCTHKNKVIFHRPRKHQVNSDPRTKPKSPTQNTKKMSTSRLKSSPFRSPLWNEVNFHVPTQKRTKFDHPHKKHINSDAYTEIKSMSIPTLTHWRRVNFDLPHKTPVSRSPH